MSGSLIKAAQQKPYIIFSPIPQEEVCIDAIVLYVQHICMCFIHSIYVLDGCNVYCLCAVRCVFSLVCPLQLFVM